MQNSAFISPKDLPVSQLSEILSLKKASPFLFLDIVYMKKSRKDKFLQYEIHGKPAVHFDKVGIVSDDPLDRNAFLEKLEARLEELKVTFALFRS